MLTTSSVTKSPLPIDCSISFPISVFFLTSFLMRGIFYPLTREISKSYIFPFNWILIGFYGFFLDLIKAPGYLFGAILLFPLFPFLLPIINKIMGKQIQGLSTNNEN